MQRSWQTEATLRSEEVDALHMAMIALVDLEKLLCGEENRRLALGDVRTGAVLAVERRPENESGLLPGYRWERVEEPGEARQLRSALTVLYGLLDRLGRNASTTRPGLDNEATVEGGGTDA